MISHDSHLAAAHFEALKKLPALVAAAVAREWGPDPCKAHEVMPGRDCFGKLVRRVP